MFSDADGPTSIREAAAHYARRGWHVFPCHTVLDGRCSCGRADCGNAGKHPRTKNGLKDATCDLAQIERWWPVNASAQPNTAIATGRSSGIVVIDVDPRHSGDETLTSLEAELGELPREWAVNTGGGGLHVYFRYPGDTDIRSRNGWRLGIDIKANGGYVVAPPSVHRSGARYQWWHQHGAEPPPLPLQWLRVIASEGAAVTTESPATADGRSLLLQRAQQYAAAVQAVAEGSRNDAAFRLAGHVASFGTDGGERLGEADVLGVVQTWNLRCDPPLPAEELRTCVASALKNGQPRAPKEVDTSAPADSDDVAAASESHGKSQATLLVELAAEADLFHDVDGEAYARVPVGEGGELHWQVARVRTRPFKRWLAQRFYRTEGKVANAQAQQDALGVIEARAIFDGQRRDVHVRVAGYEGRIYFDLCNGRWQVVEIDRTGWRVLDNSPVVFRRSKAMLPVPVPRRDGDISRLRQFANVTDVDWPLVLAWLVATMRPSGPYPVLAVYGEHGSGKSGLCRRLRSLVDPNSAPLRGDYREPRDLMICANNGWVVALDNLSTIRPWLSDCFCRLSTGGGFSTRTLFADDEETIFSATRPLMLNCIDEAVTRSDLLDRCVTVNLPRIDQRRRVPEKRLDHQFEAARPHILGSLLSAVVAALQNEQSVEPPLLPRMADFAIWATAAEPGLGLRPGQFLEVYQANRDASNETALEASPVGRLLVQFVSEVGRWSGTSTQLLGELENLGDEKSVKA